MKKLCLGLGFLCAAVSASVLAEDDDSIPWKTVEGWQISVDQTMGNSCFAYSAFEGDSVVRLGFDQDADLYFLVGDTDWKSLEAGKQYDIEIRFGDESPWLASATAVDFYGVPVLSVRIISREKVSFFLAEFMREHGIAVYYQGDRILNLSLKGSFKAGSELLECEKTMLEMPKRREDPFVKPSKNRKDPFAA